MQRVEYNVGIFAKRIFGKMNAIHVTPGPFSIFRRSVFETIGLFKHAHNTEDMEIAFRIQMHGYRIANCPTAEVYTITPRTVKKLYRQRTRWIYGFIQNCIDYRRLFLNKKYGNIGTFTLPFAAVGIVTTVLLFLIGIYHFITFISEKIREISLIGFHFHMPTPSWFFINTELVVVLGVLVLGIGFVIMLLGRQAAEGTMKPSLDMAYFIVGYTIIAPFWLSKAVFNTVLSRKTPWR
jgi:cellulose synthase/poly-beta-1,6-N-acetylglucosamine synthase-like glycosyltransferase